MGGNTSTHGTRTLTLHKSNTTKEDVGYYTQTGRTYLNIVRVLAFVHTPHFHHHRMQHSLSLASGHLKTLILLTLECAQLGTPIELRSTMRARNDHEHLARSC
jgi:hypothetical protein